MPAVSLARETYVADHATDTTTLYEHPRAVPPDLIEFLKKRFVPGDISELTFPIFVFLKRPIWW
jgi:hypothetical protein